jgi:hypothetical protein
MNTSILVRMENREFEKRLRILERVKGIEPSYSAWKAAALPLSYTRAGDELTWHAGGLNSSCIGSDPWCSLQTAFCSAGALHTGRT